MDEWSICVQRFNDVSNMLTCVWRCVYVCVCGSEVELSLRQETLFIDQKEQQLMSGYRQGTPDPRDIPVTFRDLPGS